METRHRGLRSTLLGTGFGMALLAVGSATAAPSTQVAVTGHVTTPRIYTLSDLESLPATTQTVSFQAGASPQTHTYTGVALWGFLDDPAVGIVTDPSIKNDVLRKYLVATGSDGYQAIISLGEIDPLFGKKPYFIAYDETVNGVSQGLGKDGFARLAVPGDVKGGRYVSNLVSLEIFDATAVPVPEPRTWMLLVAGLALLAWQGRARARIGAAIR